MAETPQPQRGDRVRVTFEATFLTAADTAVTYFEHERGTYALPKGSIQAVEIVAPPKPPEPQGLGAVVEDAEGRLWTRYDARDPQPWWRTSTGDPNEPIECRFAYADIAAVRILSEGVQ